MEHRRGPYDGSLYYAMAYDPFLLSAETTKEILKVLDVPGYRYERPLYPMLVSLFSFGNPDHIPAALIGVNLLSIFLIGLLFYLILKKEERKGSSLWFLALIASPFLMLPLLRDLVDALLILFIIGGVYFSMNKKHSLAALSFCFGMFVKPTIALIALCYFLHVAYRRKWGVVALYVLMGALYLLWKQYVASKCGIDYFDPGLVTIVTLPLLGELSNLYMYIQQSDNFNIFFLCTLLFAIFSTFFLFLQRWETSPLTVALLMYAFFFLFISESGAIEYHGYIRSTGPLFLLQSLYGLRSGRLFFLMPSLLLTLGGWYFVLIYGINVYA